MNELQAKLARRRNLNGETGGSQQAEPEKRTSSDDKIAPKLSTPSSQINKFPSNSTQSTTTASQSASNELQNKLLRRRTLNGESQSNQDDIQPVVESQQPVSRTPSQETTLFSQSTSSNAASNSQVTDEEKRSTAEGNEEMLLSEESLFSKDSNHSFGDINSTVEENETKCDSNDTGSTHHNSEQHSDQLVDLQAQIQLQSEVSNQDNLPVSADVDKAPETTQLNEKEESSNSDFASQLNVSQQSSSQNDEGNLVNSSCDDPPRISSTDNGPPVAAEPEPLVTTAKPASIAVDSKSASSELQKKLARRRDLNGEVPGKNQQPVLSTPVIEQENFEKPSIVQSQPSPSKPSVEQKSLENPAIPTVSSTSKLLSFLSKEEDENDDLDLPFISSKLENQSSPQKKKPSLGIWNDDTVLSNLLEDDEDPLKGFSLPANKDEVTKKLFKPKPPPSPEPILPPAPPVPSSAPEVVAVPSPQVTQMKEEEIVAVDDEDDLVDMSLPQLPKKFSTPAVPSSSSTSRFKSRLAMDQTKVMNSFNEFVNGIATSKGKGRSSVAFQGGNVLDMLSPTSPVATTKEKSLLEELEGSTSTSTSSKVDGSSLHISSSISKTTTARQEIQNSFLKDFLEENDRLLKELTDVDDLNDLLSLNTVSKSVPSSSSSAAKKSSEVYQPPRLQKSNSKRTAAIRNKALFGNSLQGTVDDDDDEEEDNGRGLFEDVSPLPDSTTKTSTNYTTSPSSSSKQGNDDDLLLEERDSFKLGTSPDKALSLLMGSDKRQSYNPLEVVSQQALIRSYANASARRSSALNDEQVTTSQIKNRELLFSKEGIDDEEESDEENEGEEEAKKIPAKDRPKSRLFSSDKTNEDGGISLETKKVKKGQVVPDPEITYDEFIDKFRRCRDLAELTK
jgi:hypothetical protein